MELGAGIENETLQNLIRDCLLELNRLKFNLTELEIAKAKDTTPQKIQELENHILNKEKEVSLIKFKAEDEINLLKKQLDEKDEMCIRDRSNAVVSVTSKIIADEFNLKPLDDLEIINLAIDASLEAKVTITGSFDDATASYFGGVVVTDNKNRKFIIKEEMDEYPVLVYMPNFGSKSGNSDVNRMKVLSPLVETAFELAKSKDYFKALNLNGLIYANKMCIRDRF